jgi:hypothetical protein
MEKYIVSNIEWDGEGSEELPTEVEMNVPDLEDDYEKVEWISDRLSNRFGYCHKGFSTTPELSE